MRFFKFLVVAAGLVFLATNCTRSITKGEKVRLVIPLSGNNSSMAAGDMLRHAVVNIQVPGRPTPIVREFEFEDNPVPWGTPLDLVVNGVPSGPGLLIQFLGVFETSTGSQLITYGDSLINVAKGTTTATITATPAGDTGKEGRISGRVFSNANSGPTGTLITYYSPPNGRPKMAVEKSEMVSGWFSTFALEKTPFSYVLLESGITVFGNLTLNSPELATSTHLLKVGIPAFYRKEYRDEGSTPEIRQKPDGMHVMGYFSLTGAVSTPFLGTYKVCYPNGLVEGIPGHYGTIVNGALSDQIVTDLSGSFDPTKMYIEGGGFAITHVEWATGTNCNASGSDLFFYPNRMTDGDDSLVGVRPPFRPMDPFMKRGGFLRREYDSTNNKIVLNWAYLAGANPHYDEAAISGLDVLYKYSMGGGGGDGHDSTCETLFSQGYSTYGSITSGGTTSLDVISISGATIAPNMQYAHQFALCPFKTQADGSKRYVGNYVQSDSCTSCSETGFGWGTADAVINTSGPASSVLGTSRGRVTGVDVTNSNYDVLTITGLTPGDTGKEVLLQVAAMGSNMSSCGVFDGQTIQVGQKGFVRVLDGQASSVKVTKGSFVRGLSHLYLTGSSGANFCFINAVVVPHFRSLTVNDDIWADPFSFSFGGGIMAFRVAGLLSISSSVTVDASGTGFSPGANSNDPGDGVRGQLSSDPSNNGGLAALGFGGGGGGPYSKGGYGNTGSITAGPGGSAAMGGGGGGQSLSLVFGGGGGNDNTSPVATGGGAVFIAARYLTGGGGAIMASGTNSFGVSGGGGGGTLALLVDQVLTGTNLTLFAKGGSNSYGGPGFGGVGGGGVVAPYICDSNGITLTNSTSVQAGSGGSYSAGSTYGPEDGQVATLSGGWSPGCDN